MIKNTLFHGAKSYTILLGLHKILTQIEDLIESVTTTQPCHCLRHAQAMTDMAE
ncbi:MAG: hypothetical protein WA821_00010 [Anaerolineales bacterium]